VASKPVEAKAPAKEPKQALSDACNGEHKCICINDAIFKHDSSWATAGVGKKANNPCNMRVPHSWTPSVPYNGVYKGPNGVFARYHSVSDGVTACVELYNRMYRDLTADQLVSRWTAGGGNRAYRSAVKSCY
jgi:hypothetical protein